MHRNLVASILGLALLSACAPMKLPSITRKTSVDEACRAPAVATALARANAAWSKLARARPNADEERRLLAIHSAATADLIRALERATPSDDWRGTRFITTPAGPIAMRFAGGDRPGAIAPGTFEVLRPVQKPAPNRAVPNALRAGIGAPLIAGRTGLATPGFPPQGQHSPATAVLEFSAGISGATSVATLRLYDPRTITSIPVGDRRLPLAADFAQPARESLGERNFVAYALGGMFRPEWFLDRRGVFLTEPYRADKVPVVFVHGLQSEPSIWQNAAAAVMADPVLGPRCQVWYFVYPTALPVPRSAAALREKLTEVRNHYGVTGGTVLVGHSMGGLLSRFQAVDSGDDLWNAYFTKPPDQLGLRSDLVREARKSLIFPPQSHVRRLVFIATPHRGSKLADWFLIRMIKRLVHLPQQTLMLTKELVELNFFAVQPAAVPYLRLGGTSLDTLSPAHPYFAALGKRPIRAPFHSIIGTRGADAPLADTSDGVVPYTSAHLDGAESERTVPHWHTCTREADVVAEVIRVLREDISRQRRVDRAPARVH
jgi:pimeloyl-ACP methyl ester carboxylesterase